MFEEVGENSTAAEGIGLEGHEDQDWWGERVVGSLEVEVEGREERSWEVHRIVSLSIAIGPLPLGAEAKN